MVHLYNIQPGEELIARETIEYFLQNPHLLFATHPQIKIFSSRDELFPYFALDGNTRLYTCHLLNITEIPLPTTPYGHDDLLFAPRDCYKLGIRSWKDLETRIVTQDEKDYGH